MLAVLGLIFGIVVGVLIDPTVPTWLQPFLPVAVVAGLDALLGAGRAWLEGTFQDRVFVMSFFWNVVVACLLVFLGTQLGVGYDNCSRCGSWNSYFLEHRLDPSIDF